MEGQNALQCQIVCKSVQGVAEVWPFFDFSRWRLSAMLDLSKMADTEGAQLGSLKKLVDDGHI